MPDEPTAFSDLPASAFPFTVEFHKRPPAGSSDPVHVITVTGPGVVEIPALGWPTWVRIRYANGRTVDHEPPPYP